MTADKTVACYYCGTQVPAERPSRLDTCSQCGKYLHACRMCRYYDPQETSKQCREDDAEEVGDKQNANFCDYFSMSADAFESSAVTADSQARSDLAALFGDAEADSPPTQPQDRLQEDAEALFRK